MDDADTQDLFAGLTKRFVPAKPRNDVETDRLLDLDFRNKLFIQRKRDGQRHLVLIDSKGKVRIYSRRMDDMTAHFPLLCQALSEYGLPKRTILDGEIIVVDDNGADNFRAVGTITRAKPDKAAQREAYLITSLRFMVFDCLYFAGKPVWEQPYDYRYHQVLCNYFPIGDEAYDADDQGLVFVPQNLDSLGATMERAKAEGWEGLVCWLWDEPTVVRDGGKPKRAGCIKWKPKQEQDFIAMGYFLGSGELSKVVGGFDIAEYAPSGGGIRMCGKVGTGLDAQMRKEALKWKYPCVISVEFDKQEPDSFKLRFPVILKKHEDKTPDECIGRELEDDE
jgi:ATP-dependent DNA ligase